MHVTHGRKGTILFGVLALSLTAGLSQSAHAQSVYVSYSGGEFGLLNLANGHFTQTSNAALFGLGFTSDGSLYGLSYDNIDLYKIDPTSSQLSAPLGQISSSVFSLTASGNSIYGLVYGANSSLESISLTPQQGYFPVTPLGPPNDIEPDGLFAAGNGVLYATSMANGVSTLYSMTTSGTATAIGPTHIDLSHLSFGAGVFTNNALYGFGSDGSIYTLNTNTGAASLLPYQYDMGANGDSIFAAAFAPAAAPEPSETAALGLGVLGLAGMALRARKRKATASS